MPHTHRPIPPARFAEITEGLRERAGVAVLELVGLQSLVEGAISGRRSMVALASVLFATILNGAERATSQVDAQATQDSIHVPTYDPTHVALQAEYLAALASAFSEQVRELAREAWSSMHTDHSDLRVCQGLGCPRGDA
jgi:hypothetical protein